MPRLEDIKNGNFEVTERTSLSHNGQVYRGKKAINELVARVLPDESEQDNDSKANKAAKRLNKTETAKRDKQRADASPAPAAGANKPSDAATPPADPASDK